MINIYICLRYVLFGVFIVCNAIIASVAVWNLSLAQVVQMNFPVIAYLVFLGASGLAFIFTVIFIELARRNALTSRVWFECTWVAVYFIMELVGASAFSSLVPAKMCPKQAEKRAHGSCISTHVLLAFTWICTTILLCYLLILIISSFIHHKHDSRIWQCNIHNFPSCGSGRLASAPPTPTLPRFISRAPTIVAPKPRRPPPADLIYSYRSGLSPEYEIEHYRPPTHLASQPVPPIPAASSTLHRMQSTRLAAANYAPTTFYPQAVQSSLITQPSPSKQPQARQQANTAPSPPPLGDWPRADVLLQPSRSRRLPTSPEMSETPSASQSRQRPTGPRKRSASGDNRPPPLDLSKISVFRDR